jgi:hypothetical protein
VRARARVCVKDFITRTACDVGLLVLVAVQYVHRRNLASFCVCGEKCILVNLESQDLVLVRLRICRYVSGLLTV